MKRAVELSVSREFRVPRAFALSWPLLLSALVLVLLAASPAHGACNQGAMSGQSAGTGYLTVSGESALAAAGWTTPSVSTAQGGKVLKAGSTSGAVVTFLVEFRDQGTYKLYIRGRGSNSGSNSVAVPNGNDIENAPGGTGDPRIEFPSDNTWAWSSNNDLTQYNINSTKVNRTLRFKLGGPRGQRRNRHDPIR